MLSYLPNVITIGRMLLCAPIAMFIVWERYQDAALLFVVAAISDLVDGALARGFGWGSAWGALLDPVADKCLMLATLLSLMWMRVCPTWFCVLVIGRDLVVAGGAVAYRALIGPYRVTPLWSGKLAIALQMLSCLVMLTQAGWGLSVLIVGLVLAVASLISAWSCAAYVQIWWQRYTHARTSGVS